MWVPHMRSTSPPGSAGVPTNHGPLLDASYRRLLAHKATAGISPSVVMKTSPVRMKTSPVRRYGSVQTPVAAPSPKLWKISSVCIEHREPMSPSKNWVPVPSGKLVGTHGKLPCTTSPTRHAHIPQMATHMLLRPLSPIPGVKLMPGSPGPPRHGTPCHEEYVAANRPYTSPPVVRTPRDLSKKSPHSPSSNVQVWHGPVSMETKKVLRDLELSIQNAVAMLPPSPPNTLGTFLDDVVNGDVVPAMCHSKTKIDAGSYWEKRRVQNLLRRLLEALQERFGVEGNTPAQDLGNTAFDAMVEWAQHHTNTAGHGRSPSRGCPDVLRSFNRELFTKTLEALGSWPPELSDPDRIEVFTALLVPSSPGMRALSNGQPLPKELTRCMFCEGLSCVPFNLPDFPVPTHLLSHVFPTVLSKSSPSTAQHVSEVAQLVASLFLMEQTGMDRTRDYFLCGLVSLEDIQAALPCIVPQNLLEEAVLKIIRTGAKYFTRKEWYSLTVSVRTSPEVAQEGADACRDWSSGQGQALSPPPQHRRDDDEWTINAEEPRVTRIDSPSELECTQKMTPPHGCRALPVSHPETPVDNKFPPVSLISPTPSPSLSHAVPSLSLHGSDGSSLIGGGMPQVRGSPMRMEEKEVLAANNTAGSPCHSVVTPFFIDWSTSCRSESVDSDESTCGSYMNHVGGSPCREHGHQADEGAGATPCSEHAELHAPEKAPVATAAMCQKVMSSDDPVAWISMEMHHECRGPFLARAFMRCCQLYEVSVASQPT